MKVALKGLFAAALIAAALLAPGAANASSVQLSGIQTPVAEGVYWMSGDLVGWWYQTSYTVVRIHPAGTVQISGTEQFVGCVDADGSGTCGGADPTGTLDFAFNFSGKYDTLSFDELHGRCHHVVTAGTGDFANATGVLHFKDDPVTGCAYYSGHLDY
jgi:hypothetical protein